jgi:indole-3-glycerol phosphate synthase
MADFLDMLGRDAKQTVDAGYYRKAKKTTSSSLSLKEAVLKCGWTPIISEIKAASPSYGTLKENVNVKKVALAMGKGGATGISVLTEPKHFRGSLEAFAKVRNQVRLPTIMKDIIVSREQIDAAAKMGADAVLLIEPLFKREYCECDAHSMIHYAHSRNLEVILEAHTKEEFSSALETEADLVGINNRDLKTLKVSLETTRRILAGNNAEEKLIISESGIQTPADIRFLHECGANAFLVGSSIMKAENIEEKVRELVSAL